MFALLVVALVGGGSGSHWSRDVASVRYSASGVVIETAEHGPMLASAILLSMPPEGGDIPLTNWRWELAGELGGFSESSGTRWTTASLTVEGIWNGSTLAVDRVRALSDVPTTPFDTSNTCPYPRDVSVLADTAGVIGWSSRGNEGSCELFIRAIGPSALLEEVLASLAEHVEVEYLLSRVD